MVTGTGLTIGSPLLAITVSSPASTSFTTPRLGALLCAPFGAKIHQANDADVRTLQHDGKLAEVLIQRDQDLGIPERVREHLVVTRIARPIGRRLDVVSDSAEPLVSPAPDTTVKKNLHTLTSSQRRFDAFVTDQTPGIDQTGTDIVGLEPSIALQDDLGRVTGRQHAEHVLDGKTMPANDGLATEDRGARRDAREQGVLAPRRVLIHTGTKS